MHEQRQWHQRRQQLQKQREHTEKIVCETEIQLKFNSPIERCNIQRSNHYMCCMLSVASLFVVCWVCCCFFHIHIRELILFELKTTETVTIEQRKRRQNNDSIWFCYVYYDSATKPLIHWQTANICDVRVKRHWQTRPTESQRDRAKEIAWRISMVHTVCAWVKWWHK